MDPATFFSTASKFLSDAMNACHYSRYAHDELVDISTSWDSHSNPLTKMHLYFLKNLGMLLTCALQDFTEHAGSRQSLKAVVLLYQTRHQQLDTALPAIIQQLETKLATAVLAPTQTDISSRLEAASVLVLQLQQSLADMQAQVKDEAGSQKRQRTLPTELGAMHACLQRISL
jgi:hypothetical protein